MTETCAKGGWQRNHINEWHFDVPSFSININVVSKSNAVICNIIPVHKHTTELSQCFRYITLPLQLPVLKQRSCCGGFEKELDHHFEQKKNKVENIELEWTMRVKLYAWFEVEYWKEIKNIEHTYTMLFNIPLLWNRSSINPSQSVNIWGLPAICRVVTTPPPTPPSAIITFTKPKLCLRELYVGDCHL